jgi:hypothetical protein
MSTPDTLEAVRQAVVAGDPDARERLRAAVEGRREVKGGHLEWARVCEAAGEFGLALSEYQLALRDDGHDVTALGRLAELFEERGDLQRAIQYAERLVAEVPADEQAVAALVSLLVATEAYGRAREELERARARGLSGQAARQLEQQVEAAERQDRDTAEPEETPSEPGVPSEADVVRFAHMFAGREDVYARQWWGERGEGGYSPVREPFTPKVARNHLLGAITVGIYPVRLDDTVTFCAFDIDITKRAIARARGSVEEARRLKGLVAEVSGRLFRALSALDMPPLMEDSGYKGRHLWLFFEVPEPARVVHQFGGLVLRTVDVGTPDIQVEFFPKQGSAGGGLGNLIKLPLGIHRRTGRRSRLLGPDGTPLPDPFEALRRQPKVTRERLHAAILRLKTETPVVAPPSPGGAGDEDETAGERRRAAAAPAPPAPPPAWTEADFETNAEIAHILTRCPVLAALRLKVQRHRRLTHDEQVVLMHSLGHSGSGVLAVNYLLDACVDAPTGARLQTPLSGNPISCPKIRKRIPEVTGSVPCNCDFSFAPNRYPTPRLHLLTLPQSASAPARGQPEAVQWDPVERARTLGVLWTRRDQVLAEIARVEQELMAYLQRHNLTTLETGDGALQLVMEEGAPPALVWKPKAEATREVGASSGPNLTPGEAVRASCQDGAPDSAAGPERVVRQAAGTDEGWLDGAETPAIRPAAVPPRRGDDGGARAEG